ncbi:pyrroline-5-carboxylate reductase [Streptomyces sp. NPDC051582]|uniref:pyrroline-5-carboxylate reductase n=1 Tax=Streptomyces sp. NPDC051582 TaxID=3155167 RepID=UPI003439FF8E
MTCKVAVLGAGKMGEALLGGLLRSGWPAPALGVTCRRKRRAAEIEARHGVAPMGNTEAAAWADVLILAVKPQDMGALLAEITPAMASGTLLISVAAGLTTAFFEERVPAGVAVVRAMPNTAVLVDEGMTVLSGGSHASQQHVEQAAELFRGVGHTLTVPESQQDAATALSGSGPAYFYFLVEAMTDAGVLLGLPRDKAHELVVRSSVGASVMLRDSGTHPVELRAAVTSPAGTTISAVRELERHGVRAALMAALEAARDRSSELAASYA